MWFGRRRSPRSGRGPVHYDHRAATVDGRLHAVHSGNIGDVVFACLFLKAVHDRHGTPTALHLRHGVRADYVVPHPLKNIRMSQDLAARLRPLLLEQPCIAAVTVGPDAPPGPVLDLDAFRTLPIDLRTHLIQGWQQLCTDLWLDVFSPWITTARRPEHADTIVVSRTDRLRSEFIDYRFLGAWRDRLLFVGMPDEARRFRAETGIECATLVADDFAQLGAILASCRLLVANQGFVFTLGEAVKCPRVLESNTLAPNNFPMSANGREALFQAPFEGFVRELLA